MSNKNKFYDFKEIFESKLENMEIKINGNLIRCENHYSNLVAQVVEAKNIEKKRSVDYRRLKKYDIVVVDGKEKLISPKYSDDGKGMSEGLRFFVHNGEIYDILKEAHLETSHGGIHKMRHVVNLKYKNITRLVIALFLKHCRICNKRKYNFKKNQEKIQRKIELIIKNEIFYLATVNIIDMKSRSDDEFKYILVFQEHLTKFVILKALKTTNASETVKHLLDIFCMFGAPSVLQSDNLLFVTDVLKKLKTDWPEGKIRNGSTGQSDEVKFNKTNQDIEGMVENWITDEKSMKWTECLKFIQFQRNNEYDSDLKMSPFEALFGNRNKFVKSENDIESSVDNENSLNEPG